SEFTLRLPLTAAPPNVTTAPVMNTYASQQGRLRVLVVDDNRTLAKTLAWMCESLGQQVQVAYDGASALSIARSFLPNVVLLDIGLSGANGYEVCRQMRADPLLQQCVIVAQTGWGQQEHRDRSKAAGFDRHLVKPVMMETLEDLFASIGPP